MPGGTLRVATFNVENLFSRPTAMSGATWAEGRDVLADYAELSKLIELEPYTPADQKRIKKILDAYKLWNRNQKNPPFVVRENKGRLFKVPKGKKEVEIVASARSEWAGWVELTEEDIDADATLATGKVIEAISPDILLMVEVEDRLTLQRFNDQILKNLQNVLYAYNMLVDGNDPRGIDIGVMSRLPVQSVRSHVHAPTGGRSVFSRDCPEFEFVAPDGQPLWLIGNHLKSKGYGNPADNDARRLAQAAEAARIAKAALERSPYVIAAGDLNDTPDSAPLKPLVQDIGFKDAMAHPAYQGPPGTYKTGKQQIDYLLLSPALWAKVQDVKTERRGIYTKKGPKFPEVKSEATAASDHAALWADLRF